MNVIPGVKIAGIGLMRHVVPGALGAFFGGSAGYLLSDDEHATRNALIGGALGALGGATAGHFLLKSPLSAQPVQPAHSTVTQQPAVAPVLAPAGAKAPEGLSSAADAMVIDRRTGDHKYIFLESNASRPTQLNPDPGGRTRGKTYVKTDRSGKEHKLYPVVVDMFEHPTIKSPDGDFADVWVVKNLAEAQKQLDLMIQHGAKRFSNKLQIKQGNYCPVSGVLVIGG